jgi:hypothetical protein
LSLFMDTPATKVAQAERRDVQESCSLFSTSRCSAQPMQAGLETRASDILSHDDGRPIMLTIETCKTSVRSGRW